MKKFVASLGVAAILTTSAVPALAFSHQKYEKEHLPNLIELMRKKRAQFQQLDHHKFAKLEGKKSHFHKHGHRPGKGPKASVDAPEINAAGATIALSLIAGLISIARERKVRQD